MERLLMRREDILSQSGRRIVISTFCGMKGGGGVIQSVQPADGAAVSRASDLQCVRQTATSVAGVAHGVEGLTGKLCRALHQAAGLHLGHVSGHHDGSNTLGTEDIEQNGLQH